MDLYGFAALATVIRFIFWSFEKMMKVLDEIARKRRTLRKPKRPEEPFAQDPRD